MHGLSSHGGGTSDEGYYRYRAGHGQFVGIDIFASKHRDGVGQAD